MRRLYIVMDNSRSARGVFSPLLVLGDRLNSDGAAETAR